MPDWVVSTAFRGKDEVTSKLRKMGRGADMFGNKAARSFKKASTSALGFKSIVSGILTAGAVTRGLSLVRQGVGEVVNEFLAFDDAITAASAKFGIFNKESKSFMDLKKTARDVGAVTEFTSAQAAEGLRFLAKAGWEANAAMEALPSFVNLATASEMEFARAADIATDVMGAFGLKSDDVQQNLMNLKRTSDVMSKAVNMSNIDMEDLFETMKFAGPIAKTAGVSLEKFSAMAAFIGGAGIKASMGGTAMRTMFLNLAAPTNKALRAFKKFNIELEDSEGNLRDPIEVLKQLSGAYESMGTKQKTAMTSLLFGRRAVSGAAVSIDGATRSLGKFEQALIDSKGNAEKLAEFMRSSVNKRLQELKSTAIEVGFKFIDAFEKKIPGGIDAALKKLREFDVKPVIEDIKEIITTTKEIYTGTKEFIENYKGLLIGVGVAIAGIKLMPLIGAVVLLGTKMLAAGTAIAAWNVLLAANPIGIVVVAIAGLNAGIVTLIDNWEDLGRSFKYWIDKIRGWFSELWGNEKRLTSLRDKIKRPPPVEELAKQASERVKPSMATLDDASKASAEKWANQQSVLGEYARLKEKYSTPQNRGVPESQTEAQAKGGINFQGQLDITGAPPGSTMQSKTTGAPPIKTELLGAN